MHALDLDGHVVQRPALSTVAESPSGLSSETTSSGSDGGSVSQGLSVAPRANSLKRSPLGRSVVTALEAELDQVHHHVLPSVFTHNIQPTFTLLCGALSSSCQQLIFT